MGMPTEPLVDIMRRTMANLVFVGEHAGPSGPYEVTQLMNSFIGALAHPWEAMRDELMALPVSEAAESGWPSTPTERPGDQEPSSLGDLVRLMRNGFAHGNIEFLPGSTGDIRAIRLWNNNKAGRRTWGTIVTVDDARVFLRCFVDLIEERHRNHGWYVRGAA
jgi:hypothetical protein